eukprot:3546829-Prorocentrum_lima.AAC.1
MPPVNVACPKCCLIEGGWHVERLVATRMDGSHCLSTFLWHWLGGENKHLYASLGEFLVEWASLGLLEGIGIWSLLFLLLLFGWT